MVIVVALYRFTPFADPAALRMPLLEACEAAGVRGSLLLAREGINGTIAGTRGGIDAVLSHIRALPGCADIEWKESTAEEMPFGRMKVRLKREIVTMGVADVDPTRAVGRYVEPQDWHALIAAEAERLMLLVHHEGRAVVATGPREEMERHTEAMHEYGLWATVAKADA